MSGVALSLLARVFPSGVTSAVGSSCLRLRPGIGARLGFGSGKLVRLVGNEGMNHPPVDTSGSIPLFLIY